MPINFNFSPAGLAAVLAGRAGLNQAEADAIARARQQQQDDRAYQLQQEQQATQDNRDIWDRAYKVEDLHGRLANIYADNKRADQEFTYRQGQDTVHNQLARDQFDQNTTIHNQQEQTRRDDLARKEAADNANAAKAAAADKLARDKMAQQADQWSQGLAAKNNWHDQDIAQRDAESQRRTEVAMGKVKTGQVKMDPLELKRHGAVIDGAKNYYQQTKSNLSAYLNEVRTGAVMDPMEVQNSKVQQFQAEIDKAANAVKQAHEQYQSYLDGLAASAAPQPLGALPNGMQPFQHGALDGTSYQVPSSPTAQPAGAEETSTDVDGKPIVRRNGKWYYQ